MSPNAAQFVSAVDSTQHMTRVLLILAFTFASISVMSTLYALYWLILLLIQSDFLKSMVFAVFPIVSFIAGKNIDSDSAFCQVSGFALAIGIQSSDIAVLLIALHSAMYIFRPRSGLYPYRQIAYLVFYLYPVLTASLAFIKGNGYENMGPYCYLRTDRGWARLSLSWIPRYIICASIVIIYVFIYLYIRRRMGDYGRRRRSEAMQPQLHRGSIGPRSPLLCYNGLIPSTPCSRRTSATDTISTAKDRHGPSSSIIGPARLGSARTSAEVPPGSRGSVRWNWAGFTPARTSGGSRPSLDDSSDPIPPKSPTLLSPPPAHTHRRNSASPTDNDPAAEPSTTAKSNPFHLDNPQPPFNRRPSHPPPTTSTSTTTQPLSTIPSIIPDPSFITITPPPCNNNNNNNHDEENEPENATAPPHDDDPPNLQKKKTLRQLRALFAYPLVYIIIWLFPFISHILGYDNDGLPAAASSSSYDQETKPATMMMTEEWGGGKEGGRTSPHWLLIISIISLSVQGAVDCVLFMTRETPWR
ncbi:G protein-coupled glucose receptor regulating Gpa2-domain-containing protein, partial [Chaetomidium leptoderma]